MISIKNVSKWYGSFQVLSGCSTEVKKGEVVVVCGPSGSGKSTLIKCVNGLEPFQKGEILVDGVSVGDPKTDLPKLRSRIGMVFQNFELFPHMTVMRNLTLAQDRKSTRLNSSHGSSPYAVFCLKKKKGRVFFRCTQLLSLCIILTQTGWSKRG